MIWLCRLGLHRWLYEPLPSLARFCPRCGQHERPIAEGLIGLTWCRVRHNDGMNVIDRNTQTAFLRAARDKAELEFHIGTRDLYYASKHAMEHRRSPDAQAGLAAAVARCEEAEHRLVEADAALREALGAPAQ